MTSTLEAAPNNAPLIDDCMTMFDTAALQEGIDPMQLAAAHGIRARDLLARLEDVTMGKSMLLVLSRQFLDLARDLNGESDAAAA